MTASIDQLREQVSDKGYITEEAQAFADSNRSEPGPCPAWCTSEPGHKYEDVNGGLETCSRYHSVNRSGNVNITQDESNRHGVITLQPVVVNVYANDLGEDIDGNELRLRAQEMLRIADRYDEILAAQQ
jgi:hypothetical protein